MGPGPAFFQRMQAMQQEAHKKAMTVLTPPQRAIVTRYQKEHPMRMMPMGGPGGPRGMMRPRGPMGPGGPPR